MPHFGNVKMGEVIHEIPPVWNAESRVLILGTMPSPKSRERGFFYMHPQNRFWKVLPCVFDQEQRQNGIGTALLFCDFVRGRAHKCKNGST